MLEDKYSRKYITGVFLLITVNMWNEKKMLAIHCRAYNVDLQEGCEHKHSIWSSGELYHYNSTEHFETQVWNSSQIMQWTKTDFGLHSDFQLTSMKIHVNRNKGYSNP